MKKNDQVGIFARKRRYYKLFLTMKLTAILLCFAMLQVSASVFSQSTLSFTMKNASVKEVLAEIEKNSNYKFLYRNELINVNRKVDFQASGDNIESVMDKLFGTSDVVYKVFEDNLVVITNKAQAQQQKITGTVTDATTNEPILGANVIIEGTTIGVVTDADGKFSLGVSTPDVIIVVSFLGYNSERATINGQSVLDIKLVPDITKLGEVVVVGYGTTQKKTLTGSTSTVNGEFLQKSPAPNLSNSLAGRLPGLVVISRSGEPGNDNSTLRIRGANTLGDNSPLVVVDGIANRSLERIDPATIESVTVLKDASAAIYGAQAANGVILITTKRGVSGKPTITLSLNQGWNTPTVLPKMSDAATYATLINEIKTAAGLPLRYTTDDIQKYKDGSDPWGHPNTDWFKETIKKNSPQRYANLSLSGGTERVKYFVSLGTNYQDGIYYNSATNYSQGDFRSNLDAKVSDNIHISFDLAGRQENRNYPGVGGNGGAQALNIFWALNRAYPYLPARWPTGEPGPDVEYGSNPLVTVTDATGYDKQKTYVMESNMKLVINIPWVKGLSITGNASLDKTFMDRKLFQKPWYLYSWDGATLDANKNPVVIPAKKGFTDPRLREWMSDEGKTTLNALLNYERTFNRHAVKVLFGSERIIGEKMDFNAYRRFFASESLDQIVCRWGLSKR